MYRIIVLQQLWNFVNNAFDSMKILSRIIVCICIVTLPMALQAQSLIPTFAAGYGDSKSKSISLRWFVSTPHIAPQEGYTILRKKHGAPMIHQVVGYVKPPLRSIANLSRGKQSIIDTINVYIEKLRQASREPLIPWTLQYLQCVAPTVSADVMGLEFRDTTVRAGISYDYRVDIGTTTIATLSNISSQTRFSPTVSSVLIKEHTFGNVLSWDADWDNTQKIVRWIIIRRSNSKIDTVATIPKVMGNPITKRCEFVDRDSIGEHTLIQYTIIPIDYWNKEGKSFTVNVQTSKKQNAMPIPEFTSFRSEKRNVRLQWIPVDSYGYHIYREIGGVKELISRNILDPSVNSFIDTVRTPKEYFATYTITSVDSLGREGEHSQQLTVPLDDEIPPMKPRYVIVQPKERTFEIIWMNTNDGDRLGYEIARSQGKSQLFQLLTPIPVSDTVLLDTTLLSMKTGIYIYRVRTVDIFGNKSEWSDEIMVSLPDISVPSAPVITDIRGTDSSIELRWQRVTEVDLAGYWINRTEDTLFTPVTLNEELLPKEKTQYSDSLIKSGILYYYEIVSVDSTLNISAPSLRLSARSYDKNQPLPPLIDSLYIKEGIVHITWFFEYPPPEPLTVVVERSRDDKRYVQISAPIAQNEVAYTDKDIRNGEKYYYRLRALSKEGSYGKPCLPREIQSGIP